MSTNVWLKIKETSCKARASCWVEPWYWVVVFWSQLRG